MVLDLRRRRRSASTCIGGGGCPPSGLPTPQQLHFLSTLLHARPWCKAAGSLLLSHFKACCISPCRQAVGLLTEKPCRGLFILPMLPSALPERHTQVPVSQCGHQISPHLRHPGQCFYLSSLPGWISLESRLLLSKSEQAGPPHYTHMHNRVALPSSSLPVCKGFRPPTSCWDVIPGMTELSRSQPRGGGGWSPQWPPGAILASRLYSKSRNIFGEEKVGGEKRWDCRGKEEGREWVIVQCKVSGGFRESEKTEGGGGVGGYRRGARLNVS